MSSGEQRRSVRISEMDARRAQQLKSQNKDKRTCEAEMEDLYTEEVEVNQKRGRKKTKIRSIQDLAVDTVGDEIQTAGNSSHEDHQPNSAEVSSETALTERRHLELLLGLLKRRDWYNIFQEPVNPNEVEGYYETIKKPMDFGTISRKLYGGSYKTLAEFKHDVFLVFSNAMLFNSSSTIYYRQARAIRDLAQKLFDTLKTDPKNFERECSAMRLRIDGRMNFGSLDEPTDWLASEGSRDERPHQNREEDRLGTYRPWETFLSENEAIISSVYKSPDQLNPRLKTKMDEIGYEGSLMEFIRDLGPTPQTAAREKLQKWRADEALKHQIAIAHLEPQNRMYEIPNVVSGHNGFPTVLPADFYKDYTRSQNFSGKMDILDNKLNAQKASTLGSPSINYTFEGGFFQAGNKVENTSAYGGKLVQGLTDGGVSFKQNTAHHGIGTPYLSTVWNNSGGNSTNLISDPINKGKNVVMAEASSVSKENPGNLDRKLVPPIREGYNSLKDNLSYEGIGKYFSSSPAGNIIPSLSTIRDAHSNWDKVVLSPINMGTNFQMAEAASSYPLQNPGDLQGRSFQPVKEEANAFKQNLSDHGIGSSHLYPFLLGGGDSYFSNAENKKLYNTNNFVPGAIYTGVNVQTAVANPTSLQETPGDNLGKSSETMRETGAAFNELTPNQGIGSAFSTPLLLDGNLYFPAQQNSSNNPGVFIPTTINTKAMNVPPPGMISSGPSMLDTLFTGDHSILPSTTQDLLFPAVTSGMDLHSLIGGVNQVQAVGAGGTSYEGKLGQTGQTLSWLQPTQWAPQPIFNFPMQDQSRTAEVDLPGQAASADRQARRTDTANGQLMTDTSIMNRRHSTYSGRERSNTGGPLYHNHLQTGR